MHVEHLPLEMIRPIQTSQLDFSGGLIPVASRDSSLFVHSGNQTSYMKQTGFVHPRELRFAEKERTIGK
jgi:hypothetical protein